MRWFQKRKTTGPSWAMRGLVQADRNEGRRRIAHDDDNAMLGQTQTRKSVLPYGVKVSHDPSEAVHSAPQLALQLKGDHYPEAERET